MKLFVYKKYLVNNVYAWFINQWIDIVFDKTIIGTDFSMNKTLVIKVSIIQT